MGNQNESPKLNSDISYRSLDSATSSPHSNPDKLFGAHGKSMKLMGLNDSTMIVHKKLTTKKNGAKYNSVYSNEWIPSNTNQIHKWSIEIKKMTTHMKIGFTSGDFHRDACFEKGTNNYYYSYWPNGKCIINTPNAQRKIIRKAESDSDRTRFQEGDVIKIALDLSNKRVCFGRLKEIDIFTSDNIGYKLVVSASNKGDCVIIKDYNVEYRD